MKTFILIFFFIFLVIFGISLYFRKKKSKLQYFIPVFSAALGLVIIIFSLIIGGWNGMGLGIYGFCLFLSSAIVFMIVAMIENMSELKKHYRP